MRRSFMFWTFWHNSFDDIIGNDPEELTAAVAAQFGPASLGGELPADATVDSDEEEEVVVGTLKVLASIAQGHRLRGDAEKLGFPLNLEFDGKADPCRRHRARHRGGTDVHRRRSDEARVRETTEGSRQMAEGAREEKEEGPRSSTCRLRGRIGAESIQHRCAREVGRQADPANGRCSW